MYVSVSLSVHVYTSLSVCELKCVHVCASLSVCMCVCVSLSVYMHTTNMKIPTQARSQPPLGTVELQAVVSSLLWCSELRPGPLQEQPEFFTTSISSAPHLIS